MDTCSPRLYLGGRDRDLERGCVSCELWCAVTADPVWDALLCPECRALPRCDVCGEVCPQTKPWPTYYCSQRCERLDNPYPY